MTEDLQKRTCRVCGQDYDYPVAGSLATHFHCEQCVALPAALRRVLEIFRRDIRRLQRQLQDRRTED